MQLVDNAKDVSSTYKI